MSLGICEHVFYLETKANGYLKNEPLTNTAARKNARRKIWNCISGVYKAEPKRDVKGSDNV